MMASTNVLIVLNLLKKAHELAIFGVIPHIILANFWTIFYSDFKISKFSLIAVFLFECKFEFIQTSHLLLLLITIIDGRISKIPNLWYNL
jgi:hypothetical protein